MSKTEPFDQEVTALFEELLDEYLNGHIQQIPSSDNKSDLEIRLFDDIAEKRAIDEFIISPCRCGKNCQKKFSAKETSEARKNFRLLSLEKRNISILSQLRSFLRHTESAHSARRKSIRKRQKFEYRINIDRRVCKDIFLFYHGETPKRIERLQKHLIENGTIPPMHGNVGRKPANACSEQKREMVKLFVTVHGGLTSLNY